MKRLLKTGGARVLSLSSNVVERFVIPLRLAKLKVARIKALTWIVPMILQVNGSQLALGLFSRPLREDTQALATTFTPAVEEWPQNDQVVATFYSRAVLGAAPTSFQSAPFSVVFPDPNMVVINDLTLAVIASQDLDVVVGVEIYYDQETVSKDEWLRMAKDY